MASYKYLKPLKLELSSAALAPTELQEQINLFQWVAIQSPQYPELELLYHINNNSRSLAKGRLNRLAGVRRGFPDLCLPVARYPYHSLYIELKRRCGPKPRIEQLAWMRALRKAGNAAAVAYGAEEASTILLRYLQKTFKHYEDGEEKDG